MAKDLGQAAEAIGKDPGLLNRTAIALYQIMLGSPGAPAALDVFAKANAVPIVRQALLTNDFSVILSAAKFFERTGDVSGLPELVNALERKSFYWGALSDSMGQATLQQTLVRAIAAVTGENAVAEPILPKNRFHQIPPKAIDQFIKEIRAWAKVMGVELYPPAEAQPWPQTEPPPPPSLDKQLDSVIMSLYKEDPSIRKDALDHLRAIRDRIDDVLKEEAAVPEKAAPGRGQP